MFIVECLPFSKGLNKDSLSYFSSEFLEPGSLLKITLRGKQKPAIVLESKSVSEHKAEIKSADFQLKKVSAVASKPFLRKEFFDAVRETAEFFAAARGGVLAQLIPSFILENPNHLSSPRLQNGESEKAATKNDVAVLQSPDDERYAHFRSLIREEFAKRKSVFLCLPQNEDVRQAKELLERGIEPFVFAFHNEMSGKELKKEWKGACGTEHPVLIIGTARWLFLPRGDLGTIIIDRENENGWKTLSRPYIDLRFFAEKFAAKKRIRAVLSDSFLRTETLHRYKEGELSEFENVKWRLSSEIKSAVIDLREMDKKTPLNAKEKEFKTLSPELLFGIRETVEKSSHMFIFAARKGLSSVIVCRDCGEQVKCGNCSSPMVLYRTSDGGAFKCHQCGETRDAAEVCEKCGSWKLAAFGAGIDRVAEEIRKNFPELKFFEIHKDVTATAAKALAAAEEFYLSRGSVLLGTEMAFPYLSKKIAFTSIASFDSLFSIPDFRIREKIFRLILQTRNLAKEKFLIQTRNPADPTIEHAISGNLTEFYRKEIDERGSLGYPPFGTFIKITVRGGRVFTSKESEKLKSALKNWNPAVFNSIHEKRGEQSAVNAVIKIPKRDWPHPTQGSLDLGSIIRSLPPHFEVKVDPDDLL